MWKSCARVWPRSRRCAGFPSWGRAVSHARLGRRGLARAAPICPRGARRHRRRRRAPSASVELHRLRPAFARARRGRALCFLRQSRHGRPDLAVLPGSKTTLDDARWLAASGIGALCTRAFGRGHAGARHMRRLPAFGRRAFRPARQGRRWHRARPRAHPCKYGVQGGKAPRPVGASHHGAPKARSRCGTA